MSSNPFFLFVIYVCAGNDSDIEFLHGVQADAGQPAQVCVIAAAAVNVYKSGIMADLKWLAAVLAQEIYTGMADDGDCIFDRRRPVRFRPCPDSVIGRMPGPTVNQVKVLSVYANSHMVRCVPKEFQDFHALCRIGFVHQCPSGGAGAIHVPDSFGFRFMVQNIVDAHQFMVTFDKMKIPTAHDILRDFDSVGFSVDDVADDIDIIGHVGLDFIQHGLISVIFAMNVSHDVMHEKSFLS